MIESRTHERFTVTPRSGSRRVSFSFEMRGESAVSYPRTTAPLAEGSLRARACRVLRSASVMGASLMVGALAGWASYLGTRLVQSPVTAAITGAAAGSLVAVGLHAGIAHLLARRARQPVTHLPTGPQDEAAGPTPSPDSSPEDPVTATAV